MILFPKKIIIGDANLIFCQVVALLGFYNYIRAWLANPGRITQINEKEYIEQYSQFYDGIAFKRDNKCKTCDIVK